MTSSRLADRRSGSDLELKFPRICTERNIPILSVKQWVKDALELTCDAHPNYSSLDIKFMLGGSPVWGELKNRKKPFNLWEDYRVRAALDIGVPAYMVEQLPDRWRWAPVSAMENVPADVWFRSYGPGSNELQWMWHRAWPKNSFKEGLILDVTSSSTQLKMDI